MPAVGYSAEYLKSVVSSAKIYVRPMQKDLDLSPVDVGCHYVLQVETPPFIMLRAWV